MEGERSSDLPEVSNALNPGFVKGQVLVAVYAAAVDKVAGIRQMLTEFGDLQERVARLVQLETQAAGQWLRLVKRDESEVALVTTGPVFVGLYQGYVAKLVAEGVRNELDVGDNMDVLTFEDIPPAVRQALTLPAE